MFIAGLGKPVKTRLLFLNNKTKWITFLKMARTCQKTYVDVEDVVLFFFRGASSK
jgi:hypothetical protein